MECEPVPWVRTSGPGPNVGAFALPSPAPYDLRGSFVLLPASEGMALLQVARQAGYSVAVCDRHEAGIVDDVDPVKL